MKPHLCVFLALSYTFLASLVEVDCQESTVNFLPVFLEKPAETYYLVRRKPVLIACEASNALRITFQCNGQGVLPDAQKNYDKFDPETGRTIVRSILEVTRTEVVQAADKGYEGFWCECFAWSTPEDDPNPKSIQTRRANVVMAYLNRKFTRDPSDQKAKVGSKVEFVCIPPEGGPIPTILWRKDGKEVQPGPDDRMEVTAEGSLVIRRVREADQGSYDCVAHNSAGKRVSRSAELTIHEPMMLVDGRVDEEEQTSADDPNQGLPEMPVFTEEPSTENYVAENKPVKLFCRVIGADILTFNCNGRRVARDRTDLVETMDPGSRVRIIEGSYDVTPDQVSMNNDKYDCHCVAWYTRPSFRGWRTSESRMAVTKLATLEESFVLEPSSELVGVGDSLDLYCTPPIGTPEAKIRWTKDGNSISASDRNYKVDASGTLTIRTVSRADAGTYICIANNPANTRRSRPAVITVSDQPVSRRTTPTTTRQTTPSAPTNEPVFIEEPESTYYIFDNPVTASGVVRGADMMDVRCLGERLSRDHLKTEVEMDRATNQRVISFSFSVERDVVARTPAPYICSLHAWYVKTGESNWSVKGGTDITFEIGSMGTEFQEEPETQKVAAGGTATFRCIPPVATPPFTVSWRRDSRRVQASDRVSITDDTLTISDVMESDAGLYACSAEHAFTGTILSRSATLAVTAGDSPMTTDSMTTMKMTDGRTDDGVMMMTTPMMAETTTPPAGYPFFTLQPKEHYYLIRDSPAVITVAVRDSQIISFECNGMRVARGESSTRSVVDSESGQQVSEKMLTVSENEFAFHQGDEYKCLSRTYYTNPATGNLDNITSNVFQISKAYLRKNFMATPMSNVVALNSRVQLECSPPKGVPQPTVAWYKDNEILEDSERVMTSEDGNLVISAMRPEDAGSYVCVAENIFARRSTSPAQLSFIDSVDITPTPEPTTPDDMETSGTEMYDSPPVFVAHSPDVVYAATDAPAELMCEATNTMKITFTCNAQQIDEARVMTVDGSHEGTGNRTLVAKLMVKKQEVLDADDPDSFWCQCYAHYNVPGVSSAQYELGKRIYIRLAYLDDFQDMENKEMVATKGNPTSIPCVAPDGMPSPTISWMKNGQPLDLSANPNLKWPIRGQLLIISLGPEDVGIYKCVAKNSAGERHGGEVAISIDGMTVDTPEPEPSSEPTTESTGMDTTVAMENASLVIDTFEVVTMESEESKEGMETTTDLIQSCPTRIMECGVGVTPEQICATLDRFKECLEDVVEDCKDELRADSIELAFMARDRLVQQCQEATTEPTSEPEDHTDDENMMIEKRKGCPTRLMECGVGVTPEQICATLDRFKECLEDVVEDCKDELRADSIELAFMARDRLVQQCQEASPTEEIDDGMGGDDNVITTGTGDIKNCPELQACRVDYKQTDMNYACSGLETFLRCMDNAIDECDLTVDEQPDKSLSDLAEWFEMYCQKVVVGEGSMRNCEKYQNCQIPVNTSLPTETLWTIAYWCPHVHSTMECTKMAAADCADGNTIERQNVFYELDQNAMDMCPKPVVNNPTAVPGVSEESRETPDNAAGGLTASAVAMTLVQLVITVVFTFR